MILEFKNMINFLSDALPQNNKQTYHYLLVKCGVHQAPEPVCQAEPVTNDSLVESQSSPAPDLTFQSLQGGHFAGGEGRSIL